MRHATSCSHRHVGQAQHEMAQGRSDADLYAEAAARATEPYRRRHEADRVVSPLGRIEFTMNSPLAHAANADLRYEHAESVGL